jgi:hypothetical protein
VPGATPSHGSVDFLALDLGDTVYLTAADGDGNVISLIQSLFNSFGAGFVAGDTGIALHNRGSGFNLMANHPNEVGPHKRPLHTLVPALLMKNDRPWAHPVSWAATIWRSHARRSRTWWTSVWTFSAPAKSCACVGRRELLVESGVDPDVRETHWPAASLRRRGAMGRLPGNRDRPRQRRADGAARSAEGTGSRS